MRLYCESKNNDHREDIASLDFTSLSIRNRARIEYVILNLHVRQTLNISRGATTLLHPIIRWYKYADKYRPQMFYTYECLHCMNSRISMQIRQMQYDKPTRWVDSIQSVSTPLRLGMTLPDPFCWDAHTLCCETSVLQCTLISASRCWYLTLSPPPHPHHSFSGEDSSSTFTLMFTLHCRKALQSQGMKASRSNWRSIHAHCKIRGITDK